MARALLRTPRSLLVTLLAIAAAASARIESQSVSTITSPRQQFGADVGDDYFLATYSQFEAYWKQLDRESDRLSLVDIGKTEEGRTQWMAIVSAPENIARLDRYREISRRLARAEGLSDLEATQLAKEGKAVVWIDGGLHANEVLGSQQLIELAYQLVSRDDEETTRILRDVIVLAVNANPDGHALVADWYMREPDPRRRSLDDVPRAYQKYVGHDINRDFYMSSQAETINMNRVLYREWFPQIVYDHHQTGPPGTVMFAPPFRDPFNYVFDPIIPTTIDLLGAAMHTRFVVESKPGVTMRSGSSYSTWWNGGLRTTAYFHNQVGLLTETIGDPTPEEIPFVADKLLPSADLPFPISPQPWHFRQSIDYSMTANRAVLDLASRYKDALLFNVYRMGRNAIARGSQDSWTASPHRQELVLRQRQGARGYDERLRDPQFRDPRGYILPADQPDFLTATKFIDALLKTGIDVLRASSDFMAAGKRYSRGSFVVKTAQAFRPHVLDMFEPQDHPDDVAYPGGPPTPPYDNAGWTLAYQMGVKFDRVLDGFDGPFVAVSSAKPDAGRITGAARPAGYLVGHHQNDAFVAVNRLLAGGQDVYWPADRDAGGTPEGTGVMYVPATPRATAIVQRAAADLGLTFVGVDAPPSGAALKLRPVRIALWDRYGGSSPSGWTRWLLERFEFPFEVVYVKTLDGGNLASRFDAIVLTNEAVPSRRGDRSPPDSSLPPEYRGTTGVFTWDRTVPELQQFVHAGGTLITIGGATAIAERMGVPVRTALEARVDGVTRALTRDDFYIPGSVLRVSVDNRMPLGYGFEPAVDVFFDRSPAFRLEESRGAEKVAWFASATPLRSGWAWGQRYLEGALAVVDAHVGQGRVLMFGPEIAFRGQPHGTFKFLFNAMFIGKAEAVAGIPRPSASR